MGKPFNDLNLENQHKNGYLSILALGDVNPWFMRIEVQEIDRPAFWNEHEEIKIEGRDS